MTHAAIAADLAAAADRIARLRPDFRDLDRFYSERSEIAADIRRLVRRIETDGRPRLGSITPAELDAARSWHSEQRP